MKPTHYQKWFEFGYEWRTFNWTGRVKTMTGGPEHPDVRVYYEGERFFGLFKFWVKEGSVSEFPPVKTTIKDYN